MSTETHSQLEIAPPNHLRSLQLDRLTVRVELVDPGSLPRQKGKAIRVVDEREN